MRVKLSGSLTSVQRPFLLNICALVITFCFVIPVAVAGEKSYNIYEVAKADIETQGCSYLGEVWGVSGGKLSKWNRLSASSSKHKAEEKALKMAADLNATHLVWSEHAGGFNDHRQAYADAYRCESVAKPSDIAKKRSDTGDLVN